MHVRFEQTRVTYAMHWICDPVRVIFFMHPNIPKKRLVNELETVVCVFALK